MLHRSLRAGCVALENGFVDLLVARQHDAAVFVCLKETGELFVAANGTVQAGEAGVEVAAFEEGRDCAGGFGGEAWQLVRVVAEHLPGGGGAGLTGVVTDADDLGSRSRWASRRDSQGSGHPKSWGNACAICADVARFL